MEPLTKLIIRMAAVIIWCIIVFFVAPNIKNQKFRKIVLAIGGALFFAIMTMI